MKKTRERVMLIDDDSDLRGALKALLRSEGYAVKEFGDGLRCLESLKETPDPRLPEVILLDLMMPGMDGIAFRKAQLSDDRLAKIPVFFLSASPSRLTDSGALCPSGVFPKPIQVDKLLKALRHR